jgi:pimeloyl-ACP methyl ester carboxylesterase
LKANAIKYRSSLIHYYSFGEGKKLVFCFHGYGEDASSFCILEPFLKKEFTLIAIDLPFHGKTRWAEGLFKSEHLKDIISIVAGPEQKFSLAGFSMGGRIVLQLLQLMPQKIERVILLAPDGLHKNFWYRFSTQTTIGNRVFKHTMKHPATLFKMMEWSKNLHLLNQTYYKVAQYHLNSETSRVLLYKRWTCLQSFTPNLKVIKKIIASYKLQVHFVLGAYDKVILSETAKKFVQGIEAFACIDVIEAGHQLLKEKYASTIASFFCK